MLTAVFGEGEGAGVPAGALTEELAGAGPDAVDDVLEVEGGVGPAGAVELPEEKVKVGAAGMVELLEAGVVGAAGVAAGRA